MVLGLFFFGIFGNANLASADTIAGPDADRNLFVSAELWSKYQYNATAAGEATVAEHFSTSATTLKTINETLPAGFRTTKAGIDEGEIDDLNVTGGIKYSDDVFNNFVAEPVDYDESSETLLARKLSLIPETEYSFLSDEMPMQYFTHETKELDEVQADVAASIKRTWTGSEVNITASYLRIGLSFDIFKAMIDEIKADDRWDPVDGMTPAQITAVIDDVVPKYTLGLMLGYGNVTALQAETGKSNWDLSNEFVATLDNETDASLSQFTANTAMITNGLLGYIMEYGVTDTTTAMVANGLYGPINAPDRGPLRGMEIGYEINQVTGESDSVIYIFYDAFDALTDVAADFLAGTQILLTNMVPFVEPVAPTEAVPIALTVLLSFAIMFMVMLWQGDFSFDGYMAKYKGKGKNARSMAIKTFLITAAAFFVPLILILNTYYNWY